jgi:arsenate reductase
MNEKIFNVLFLCTGNSARSVMSEALVTILGKGRFRGYSAGSHPAGQVNSYAIEQIKRFAPDYPTEGMRSKSWDEFAAPDAPHMDFIVTVCDNAAGEACPYWPGRPATAHWSYLDPAAVEGSVTDKRGAFAKVFEQIKKRMEAFVALPIETMDTGQIRQAAKQIGEMAP